MLFQTKRGTKFSRKPRNAQMPFTDPVISLKISSSGGNRFSKNAGKRPIGPRSRSPGRAAEVSAQLNKITAHPCSSRKQRCADSCFRITSCTEYLISQPLYKRFPLYTSSSPLQIRLPDFRSKSMTFAELNATFTLVPILKMSEPKTTPVRRKSPTRIFSVVSIPVGMTP